MQAPPIHKISRVQIPKTETYRLDNGIEVYQLPIPAQQVLKLELIFKAGRAEEPYPIVARAVAKLLKAGTRTHSAAELSDLLEYYGTKLKIVDDLDFSVLQVYTLSKHVEAILQILQEILSEPIFPQQELDKFVNRNKERLKLDIQKPDFVAYRVFTQALFDPTHPYYYNSSPELYDALQQNTLANFYKQAYSAEVCKIVVTGDVQGLAPLLNKHIGQLFTEKREGLTPKLFDTIYNKEQPQPIYQQINPQAPSSQACIRIGKACMDKKHPDFAGFYILNVLLGGYFGSRLMQNLREDKGYTYGVYSSIDEMRLAAYYCIETEVIAEAAADAVLQIHTEMERLQTDLVKSKELETLKSYLMGAYLNHLDGFFNLSNLWSECVRAGVDFSHIETLVQTTQEIQPKTLRALAQAYFQKADLQQVIIN